MTLTLIDVQKILSLDVAKTGRNLKIFTASGQAMASICRNSLHLWADALTEKAAKELSKYPHSIHFSELKKLHPEVASALSNCDSSLLFWKLRYLSAACAERLAKSSGKLVFNELQVLPPSIAAKLAKHNAPLIFSDLLNLKPSAARQLITHPSRLFVNLKHLDEKMAKLLSRHQGKHLCVQVTRLSSRTAYVLSKYDGALQIEINGRSRLGYKTAVALASHRGTLIYNCDKLPVNVARGLASHKGTLKIGNLTEMSLASIREISRHSGDLVLPLLNSISIAKCEVLSTHQGLLVT
jgi:hypothetical protein